MKRMCLAVVLLAMLAAVLGAARAVDPQEASSAAKALLDASRVNGISPMGLSTDVSSVEPLYGPDGTRLLGYVYALSPRGYIVVSSDTELTPIVAYSYSSDFDWAPGNLLLDLLQVDLSWRLDALGDRAMPQSVRKRNVASWTAAIEARPQPASTPTSMIGPLIEATTWAQGTPWNADCPTDPATGTRSMTGCVATSLAQILNYWRYPGSVSFSDGDSYTTFARSIHVNAPEASLSHIDYAAVSRYNPDDATMADLSYAAGVSVKMDYSADGSGAYAVDIAAALSGETVPGLTRSVHPGVWGYASATVRSYVNPQWGSPYYERPDAFYEALRADLAAGRPAILCITTAQSSRGHTIICDGYEPSSGRYHLNLGWGGHSDGWYALPEDVPPGYNVIECGILDIEPPAAPPSAPPTQRPGASSTSEGPRATVQAAPNPFSAQVVFRFSGGVVERLEVSVYGLGGRLLWTDERSETSQIAWNGVDSTGCAVANGPYVYVLRAFDASDVVVAKGTVIVHR